MAKRAKNLLLEAEALSRGEEYCRKHETTLSRLVSDFLLALPKMYEGKQATSAVVQTLHGAANWGGMRGERYRDYLFKEHKRLTKQFEDDAYLEK
jgi:hypothetical protein